MLLPCPPNARTLNVPDRCELALGNDCVLWDLPEAIGAWLAAPDACLLAASELDEQGLQVAALSRRALRVVSTKDVTICSPFWPHQPELGRCGAHFVGLEPSDVRLVTRRAGSSCRRFALSRPGAMLARREPSDGLASVVPRPWWFAHGRMPSCHLSPGGTACPISSDAPPS